MSFSWKTLSPFPSLYAKLTSCSWLLNVSNRCKCEISFLTQFSGRHTKMSNCSKRSLSSSNLLTWDLFPSFYSPVQNFPRSSICLLSHLSICLSIIRFVGFSLFHSVCFHRLLTPSSFLTIFPAFSSLLIYLSYSSSVTALFLTLLSPCVLSSMTSFWLHVNTLLRHFNLSSSSSSSAPSDQDAQEEGEKSKGCDFFFFFAQG